MDFKFSDGQEMLRKVAREFAENEVSPIAAEIDKTGRFPRETFDKMTEVMFTGIGTPEEYGGAGGSDTEKVIVVSELAKKCGATAAILSIHTIFAQVIQKYGTGEQKQKYLPRVTSGGCVGAFALTEPNAGSDAGAAKTTATLDGDEYVLNGTKCFISGGGQAQYVAVFALTDPSKGLKGLSCIIVEKGTPGFTIGKIEEKMGIHGSETVELIFDNCRVPKENLVGKEGKGFNIAMVALDGARIGVAAQALGIAEGALEESVKYMNTRVQFGKPLTALQGLTWYISDMATKIESAKWLTYYAAYLKETGQPHTKEAAMAKLNASETARFVTNLALQIHGGYGYMKDYPLERMYRDAKITEIYEGTSEIHKLVISRSVLS
ncbi:Acyl-CoA dehydrogenase [Dethiosulfatibacter aminovorans DSM 17477]|uniref:Acyl-CoA dehydrogenase n=1 Tax=Dethiosulfatibacter aminovorans DSM 17477 TaxID=1121476 RepID=A0A1M6AV30_9FIRM|nr:acryloyl-CoA reductase [Dethiosulfatibacter aminovorans]SHI40364.1 Acyl-CoA dehydrogenase [Dethiosulfatibacter aminovorans DSM 17477]